MPTPSIPIKPGSLVNDTNHPPKLAATVNTTSPNNWPPGAAVSPIITYTVTHSKAPINELREINRIKSQPFEKPSSTA